jgi:uncharacterized protein (UPF0248 family)
VTIHEVLSELVWAEGLTLEELTFLIIDRGAPGDRRTISFPEVVDRDRSYLHLAGGGRIPFHRVLEVRVGEHVRWSRDEIGDEGRRDD